MKPSRSLLLAGSLAALFVSYSAQAVDLTWNNGAATGNWNTTDANFTGNWTNGNTAVFGGTAGSTITINEAAISATGVTFNVNNDIIAQSGGNNLTLAVGNIVTVGSGLAATINAPLAGSIGVQVEGGGTLNLGGVSTIDGGGDGSKGLIVGATTSGNTVNLASGGTMGTISANRRSLYIGSSNAAAGLSTTGNNIVNISTPGNSVTPTFNASGNGGRATIGYASDDNELNVSNGAYVAQTNGGGTNTWDMGVLAGADNNKVTISGTGSTIYFSSNQYLNVGGAGDGNRLTVSAGGFFRTSRIGIGVNGGDNNYELITGSTSAINGNAGSNAYFDIGVTSGSLTNSLRIENGGTMNFGGSGTTRRVGVGMVAGADSNYISITGATSTMNFVHTGLPMVIGGKADNNVLYDGGTGNHLDVSSGATLDMDNLNAANVNVPTGSTGLALRGTDSAFNLGNGTGISTAYIGSSSLAAGVVLQNASGRLNFNSGRLVAGVTGALVSGAGAIVLNGPGYISTAFAGSTISTAISGSGTLVKEGAGTLTLNSAAATYSGSATISEGTLALTTLSPGNGKTLKGNGIVSGVIDMTNGSTFAYEVNSSTVTGNLLTVNGTVTLENSGGDKVYLTLDDLAVTDVAFATGTKFSLMNYSSTLSGGFFYGATLLTEGGSFNGALNKWTINYGDLTGGINFVGSPTGKFINLTAGALTAIPEPGSLLALGCLVGSGLFLRTRRRRA